MWTKLLIRPNGRNTFRWNQDYIKHLFFVVFYFLVVITYNFVGGQLGFLLNGFVGVYIRHNLNGNEARHYIRPVVHVYMTCIIVYNIW